LRTIKRVFVAFAVENKYYRDLLKGQSLYMRSPFDCRDMSVKVPWDSGWKERGEVTCAKEERIPLIGVYIHANAKSSPPEMNGVKEIPWVWEGIRQFIDSL
jgi:hypothetical protein